MKKIIILLIVVFCSCQDIIVNSDPEIDKAFWLKYGESKILQPANLEVGFQQILEESRCASDVVCVWEGRARVRLWVLQGQADSTFVDTVISGYVTEAHTDGHVSQDTLGYRVTLMQLDPYPVSTENPEQSEYKALLKISML